MQDKECGQSILGCFEDEAYSWPISSIINLDQIKTESTLIILLREFETQYPSEEWSWQV